MTTSKSAKRERSRPVVQCLEGRLLLTTYHVTSDQDNGVGTLRAAINSANSNLGADTIDFEIRTGPVTIEPLSELPLITGPVKIDGTTQGGYNGQPIVELDGERAGSDSDGVNGLTLAGGGSIVRGLVINRFNGSGIYAKGGENDVIENNYVGLDSTGLHALPNTYHGVSLSGKNHRVGGPNLSQRNVIAGNGGVPNLGAGVFIAATNSVIQGNYIGTDAFGSFAIPNSSGVVSFPDQFGDGSQNLLTGNLISGNSNFAALLGTNNWIIQGNIIGFDATRSYAIHLPPQFVSSQDGIVTVDSSFNTIGGTTAAEGNLIAGNNRGIVFSGAPTGGGSNSNAVQNNIISGSISTGIVVEKGTGNQITANSIHDNGALGIALAPGSLPGKPNNLQNYPVLKSAQSDGFTTTISGSLNSTPLTNFTIDFYDNQSQDFSGHGEGEVYLGSVAVKTDAAGNVNFNAVVSAGQSTPDHYLSATATAPDGSTSEFSLDQIIGSAPGPVGTPAGFQYQTFPHQVTFKFNQQLLVDSIEIKDLKIRTLPTGASAPSAENFHYDPTTQTLAFDLPPSLADGNYRATLQAGSVANYAGSGLQADVTMDFFEFRGDINRDRLVDFNDLVPLAQNYNAPGVKTLASGDVNGDQKVDFADLVLLAQRYNTRLPATGAAPVFAAEVEAPVLPMLENKHDQKKTIFSSTPVVKPAPVKSKPALSAVAKRR